MEIKELPKKLFIDYDIWLCGEPDYPIEREEGICHGEGHNSLLNKEGYMCVLGQFCEQTGATKEELLGNDLPSTIFHKHGYMIDTLMDYWGKHISTSAFSSTAMGINDHRFLPIVDKVQQLKQLFCEAGYEIEFKNFPEEYLERINNDY